MSHAMEVPNGLTPVEPFTGNAESITTGDLVSDYATIPAYTTGAEKKAALDTEITAVTTPDSASDDFEKTDNPDHIIITGADAAAHLLPLRDDGDASVTFRGIFLASCLSAFQAVMNQIYTVSQVMMMECDQIRRLSPYPVQTHFDHYSRHLHRAHCLLCRQCLGQISSPW